MANQYFRDRLLVNIAGAIQAASAARRIRHAGMQGRIREVALNQLFAPILPQDVAIGTGKIVDAYDNESDQIDLIVHSPRLVAPMLYAPDEGMFPVEACFFAIEVKTKLTSTKTQDAIKKARSLRKLRMASGSSAAPACGPVFSLLFAFDSDLTLAGKSEIERYRELDDAADTAPLVRGLCVVGRGYWIFNAAGAGSWNFVPATEDHEEVLDLIGGVVNSLPDNMAARGLPGLGAYLLSDRSHKRV